MTRFSFLFFNVLLVTAVYGIAFFETGKDAALHYKVFYFSAPCILLLVLMAIASTVRYFLSPHEDIIKSAVTYWHASWITALLTFIAYKLASGELSSLLSKGLGH